MAKGYQLALRCRNCGYSPVHIYFLLMSMPEEQWAVTEIQCVGLRGGNPLMDNSWVSKAPETTDPGMPLASAEPFACLLLLFFSVTWHG